MCNEKRLVAIIKHVDANQNLLSDTPSVLFELHDTNIEPSVHIDQELVTKGHAKFK